MKRLIENNAQVQRGKSSAQAHNFYEPFHGRLFCGAGDGVGAFDTTYVLGDAVGVAVAFLQLCHHFDWIVAKTGYNHSKS